jgi:hypothetical protein
MVPAIMGFEFRYVAQGAPGAALINHSATNYLAALATGGSSTSAFDGLAELTQQGLAVVGTASVYVDMPTPWECVEITIADPDDEIQAQLDLAIGAGRGWVLLDDFYWPRRRWFLLNRLSYARIRNRDSRKKQREMDLTAVKMAVDGGAN